MPYKIAVIVETMNVYGQGLIRGICRYLNDQPECTLFYEERTLDSPPPSWLAKWKGDGIIVRDRTGKSCRTALKTGAKVVDLSERRRPNIPTVISDHAACSQLASDHLHKRGFVHFGFVGIKGRPFSLKRHEAFVKAVGDDVHFFEMQDDEKAFASWGNDYAPLTEWLNRIPKPIGIMACYDLAGISVLQACRLSGLNVPDSVADIGGRRLGGIGRVFLEGGDFGFENSDAFQRCFEQCFEFGDSLDLDVHTPCFTPFSSFHQHQFTRFTAQMP